MNGIFKNVSRARWRSALLACAGGIVLTILAASPAWAAAPVVSNVVAAQRAETKLVDISYDVADADEDALTISVEISSDGGATYLVPATALSEGATANSYPVVSFPVGVPSLTNRTIVWDAGANFNEEFNSQMVVRVIADDGPAPLPGMVIIPAGAFSMGDGTGAGIPQELPVHMVTVSGFSMDETEVTEELWDSVRTWALAHGYSGSALGIPDRGAGKGPDHPAQNVNWYTAVKWCNARSEKDGLTPVYYTNAGQTTVYRFLEIDLAETFVNWSANGYRLPTEAEWEKAARGSLAGKNFPWGGVNVNEGLDINGGNANYFGGGDPFEGGGFPETSTAGYFTPNVYGLRDMAGNVREWCWDVFSSTWYNNAGAILDDTRGPAFMTGDERVQRGGAWSTMSPPDNLRCASRSNDNPATGKNQSTGFRCVRGL